MKKDIELHKVEDMALAIVPREDALIGEDDLWDCFLLNLRDEPIQNVLVSSKGYGELNGEPLRTTLLRHFFEEVGPLQVIQIEPIQTRLFQITNEYWVSFTLNNYMYDKKYVFVKGSINESNFTRIPFLDRKGVMIR